jgi:hypothetical protein
MTANFYALNASRGYPLDDTATGISDTGEKLPDGVIVDCTLRFPDTYGALAFVSATTATAQVTTVIVNASSALNSDESLPLAAVNISGRPVFGRAYEFRALVDGVAGWIVFGQLSDAEFQGRFTTAAQGLLLPRCCRAFNALPIPYIALEPPSRKLKGLVSLFGGVDISVIQARRFIDGAFRNCIAIGLEGNRADLLAKYVGACGARPESNNCQSDPIEAINDALPDEFGNIEIVFDGFDTSTIDGGAVINSKLGFDRLCTSIDLPDNGVDLCDPTVFVSEIVETFADTPDDTAPTQPAPTGDSEFVDAVDYLMVSYPYTVRFFTDTPADVNENAFFRTIGIAPYYPDPHVSEPDSTWEILSATSTVPRVAALSDSVYTINRDVTVSALVRAGGADDSAGLVTDYIIDTYGPTYVSLAIHYSDGEIRLQRHAPDGSVIVLARIENFSPLVNVWYRVQLRIQSAVTSNSVNFVGIIDRWDSLANDWVAEGRTRLTAFNYAQYSDNRGKFGLYLSGAQPQAAYLGITSP